MIEISTFDVFSGYAKIFSVFWLFYCIWSARKIFFGIEQRQKECAEMIEGVVGMLRMFSSSVLRGMFVFFWAFISVVDLLGILLLLQFTGGDWWAKLLTLVVLLGSVHSAKSMLTTLRCMDDEGRLRAVLEKEMEPLPLWWEKVPLVARLLAAVTLAVIVHL